MTKKLSECPYCKRPADENGSIFHVGGCTALQDDGLTQEVERLRACLLEMYQSDGESSKAFSDAQRLLWPDGEPVEPGARPTPEQLAQRWAPVLKALANDEPRVLDIQEGVSASGVGGEIKIDEGTAHEIGRES